MYNDRMVGAGYEIRKCDSCGLRYPITVGHPLGTRCPICMGETRLILSRQLVTEPARFPTLTPSHELKANRAVILDNIRSAWNVGSILRSADGFGFTHAYLCGITPTPDNEAVTKTSLGAEDSVPWSYHKDAVKLANGLKQEGWRIFALEEDKLATKITHLFAENRHTALIVGNEISGVDPELLGVCDDIVFIPMRGEKKSFNVAVAFGIAAFALDHKQNEQ
jgi:23S rRNA (guanosine2251-2'-O)-methyltransferase